MRCRWGAEADGTRRSPESSVGLTPPRVSELTSWGAMSETALTLRPLQAGDCDRLLSWIDSEDAMYRWSGARAFS